uniref:Uncharacterized protein n=1 Tax=Arundo donax TaxID=35708 RepID=A0A0A9B205_ARUDO
MLPADGTRGGILIAWKGAICQALSTHVDTFSVLVQFVESEGVLKMIHQSKNSCRS